MGKKDNEPIPEFKTFSSEKRAEYVVQVRAELESKTLSEADRAWTTDDTVLRYLWGWKYNVKQAAEQIVKTIEWRNVFKPQEIRLEEVAEILKKGALYVAGNDKDGGPVFYFNPNIWMDGLKDVTDEKESAIRVRAMVFVMEHTIRHFPPGVTKYSWVVDMEDKLSDLFAIKRRKQNAALAQLFNDHFPEHLAYAVGVNPPTILKAAWKVFKKFLDPETIRKTRFVGKKEFHLILDLIPKDQLLQPYGGDSPKKFDWEEFERVYSQP